MSELVSILIPAYNAQKWIKYTINSALCQTWPKKEIIIVNDGSLDKTLQIAKQFESKSVKVISQENKGASAARNKALEYAQGDYIQWLDADDLLAPSKISEQMKVAESGQTSLTLYSSSHGVFYWRLEKARFAPNALWQDLTPVEWILKKFSENLWMVPAVWLVGRRMTEKAGLWDERLSWDDDGEYFCRVVAASESVKFVREARCYYRHSGFNQLSRCTSEKAYRSSLLSLTLSIRYLRLLEESERTREACLKLLQSCLPLFYPERAELLEKMNALSLELGRKLTPPRLEMKYDVLRRLFGRNTAERVMIICRKLKLFTIVKWDELLYRITTGSDLGIRHSKVNLRKTSGVDQ